MPYMYAERGHVCVRCMVQVWYGVMLCVSQAAGGQRVSHDSLAAMVGHFSEKNLHLKSPSRKRPIGQSGCFPIGQNRLSHDLLLSSCVCGDALGAQFSLLRTPKIFRRAGYLSTQLLSRVPAAVGSEEANYSTLKLSTAPGHYRSLCVMSIAPRDTILNSQDTYSLASLSCALVLHSDVRPPCALS